MTKHISIRPLRQAGFTLVEIMVGLAIGMLATLVILQVMAMFEAQKRVTTGSADAQTNGSIALYNIVREVSLAGYSLMPIDDSPLECATLTFGTTGITSITPVSLTDGTSDSITLSYGDSEMGGIPMTITGMGAPTANDATVNNNLGCKTGDIALISNGSTCALTTITDVSAASAVPPAIISLAETTTAISDANLSCLGNWNEITFGVNGNNLTREGTAIMAGIVNMQAQYGVSASADSNQVVQWVDPTGIWDTSVLTLANRNRIKAIRIAVVARTDRLEANDVTTAITSWADSASSPAPAIDLSADANWKRYRYRVFETIVPLRNVIWARDTL
ncbi:MAG: PilW family protein [Nitrosomonadales bacterium]|nr:PilW family protein [Nitrosomonadales bacterium]